MVESVSVTEFIICHIASLISARTDADFPASCVVSHAISLILLMLVEYHPRPTSPDVSVSNAFHVSPLVIVAVASKHIHSDSGVVVGGSGTFIPYGPM